MLYQEKMQWNEKPNEQMLSCFVYKNYRPDFVYHWHTYFEIFYIIKNMTVITLNGKSHICKPGDMVFIPAMVLHSLSYANNEPSENLILQFNKNLLEQGMSDLIKINTIKRGKMLLNDIAYNIGPDSQIRQIFTELQDLCEKHPDGSAFKQFDTTDKNTEIAEYLRVKGLTFSLISLMMKENIINCTEEDEKCYDLSEISKLEPVLKRMSEHVEEKLSMEAAAKMAGMSYYNFSRTFNQVVGMSFKEHQNKLCVWRAEELLYQTDRSIMEIAEMVNFSTLSYFNKIFKKYNGKSPSEYRKNILIQKDN
jgi:AraC-like DNA-binding protein